MNDQELGRQEEEKESDSATSQPLSSRRADHFTERARYAYLFHL